MSKVVVCCRIRPFNDAETAGNVNGQPLPDASLLASALDGSDQGNTSVRTSSGQTFSLDQCFGPEATQEQVFDRVAAPLIADAFKGINCTLFTYGQTGSGKTFTLQGEPGNDTNEGIVMRSARLIFKLIGELDDDTDCSVGLSVIEIYNEKLKDLLSSTSSSTSYKQGDRSGCNVGTAGGAGADSGDEGKHGARKCGNSSGGRGGSGSSAAALRIRDIAGSATGGVWVEGLTKTTIRSASCFGDSLAAAMKKRATGSHSMNATSSRSHMICIVTLRQTMRSIGQRIASKLHLVDLAGSEMVRKTDASGSRLEEAKHINKSLSALGNVIYALTQAETQQTGANTANTGSSALNRTASFNGSGNIASLSLSAAASDLLASTSTSFNGTLTSSSLNGTQILTAAAPTATKHIPYRDSKLTRLLQDSLGGNSKTTLILAVSPAAIHLPESIATLRFGERARLMRTKPKINSEIQADERKLKDALRKAERQISLLNGTILDLHGQLQIAQAQLRNNNSKSTMNNNNTSLIDSGISPHGIAYNDNSHLRCVECLRFIEAEQEDADASKINMQQQESSRDQRFPQAAAPPPPQAGAAQVTTTGEPRKNGITQTKSKNSKKSTIDERDDSGSGRGGSSSDSGSDSSATSPTLPHRVRKGSIRLWDHVIGGGVGSGGGGAGAGEEPLRRCAVCGLTDDEADVLRRETGEGLGALFLCDGNCGDFFHCRCVGLIGDAGQFIFPEGEWYCTNCSCAWDLEDGISSSSENDEEEDIDPMYSSSGRKKRKRGGNGEKKKNMNHSHSHHRRSAKKVATDGSATTSGTSTVQSTTIDSDAEGEENTIERTRNTTGTSSRRTSSSIKDDNEEYEDEDADEEYEDTQDTSHSSYLPPRQPNHNRTNNVGLPKRNFNKGSGGTQPDGYAVSQGLGEVLGLPAGLPVSAAVLSSLKAEYHVMRRERNRVLSQWQQEKRVAAMMETRRRAAELARDQRIERESSEREEELAGEKRRTAQLSAELEAQRVECARLREMNDQLSRNVAGGISLAEDELKKHRGKGGAVQQQLKSQGPKTSLSRDAATILSSVANNTASTSVSTTYTSNNPIVEVSFGHHLGDDNDGSDDDDENDSDEDDKDDRSSTDRHPQHSEQHDHCNEGDGDDVGGDVVVEVAVSNLRSSLRSSFDKFTLAAAAAATAAELHSQSSLQHSSSTVGDDDDESKGRNHGGGDNGTTTENATVATAKNKKQKGGASFDRIKQIAASFNNNNKGTAAVVQSSENDTAPSQTTTSIFIGAPTTLQVLERNDCDGFPTSPRPLLNSASSPTVRGSSTCNHDDNDDNDDTILTTHGPPRSYHDFDHPPPLRQQRGVEASSSSATSSISTSSSVLTGAFRPQYRGNLQQARSNGEDIVAIRDDGEKSMIDRGGPSSSSQQQPISSSSAAVTYFSRSAGDSTLPWPSTSTRGDDTTRGDTTTGDTTTSTNSLLEQQQKHRHIITGTPSIDDGTDTAPISSSNIIGAEGERLQLPNPFKNRIKDLIKSVQEETGAIVELREKHQHRVVTREQRDNNSREGVGGCRATTGGV